MFGLLLLYLGSFSLIACIFWFPFLCFCVFVFFCLFFQGGEKGWGVELYMGGDVGGSEKSWGVGNT